MGDLGESQTARRGKLDLVRYLLAGERALQVRSARVIHFRAHHFVDAAPEDLAARPIEPDLVGPVDEAEDLIAVDIGDQDGQGVGDRSQPSFARDRLLFGELSLGDVDMRPDERCRLAVGVALDLADRADPAHGPVAWSNDAVFRLVFAACACDGCEQTLDRAWPVLGVQALGPGVVRLDRRLGRQAVDLQIFRRPAGQEIVAHVDPHAPN